MKITAKHLKILERIFVAEINNKLPFQFPRREPKELPDLITEGYILTYEITLGGGFLVLVRGYQLSHLGRLTYCSSL